MIVDVVTLVAKEREMAACNQVVSWLRQGLVEKKSSSFRHLFGGPFSKEKRLKTSKRNMELTSENQD